MALLERSLRVDARSWQPHLVRFGLLVAIEIALINILMVRGRFGAPGLIFFRTIFVLDAIFIALLGASFFSTAISEEKEEETLGMMQMAGINPLGILLGKLGGRLTQTLLLIAVQYPLTLLAVTMGGVTAHQIQAAFLALGALVVFEAGLGLLCSTIASSSRHAVSMMVLMMIGYIAIPYACHESLVTMARRNVLVDTLPFQLLSTVSQCCLFLQISPIMTTNYTESVWSSQVISNSLIGITALLMAWLLFPKFSLNRASEAVSRGLMARRGSRLSFLAPPRPWVNPFLWKEFYFQGNGAVGIGVRILFYVLLGLGTTVLSEYWWNSGTNHLAEMVMTQVMALGTLEIAILVARSIRDEIRGRTVSTLMLLPWTPATMLYSKLGGFSLAAWPALAVLFVCCCTPSGAHAVQDFLDREAGYFFLAHFLLVPHLAAVLALYLRWGSVPLAIGGAIGSMASWISMFDALRIGPGDTLVWTGTISVIGLCAFLQYWVINRFPTASD